MRHVTLLCALLLGACMPSQPAPSTTSTAASAGSLPASTASAVTADDPHLWLEDIEGARAMQWVKARNAKSLGVLQGDPRYEQLHAEALRIVEATDRIAMPEIRGRTIYNFWQDPTHVRGILRRTTLESYRSANTGWEVVLDLDALSARDNVNWVYHGTSCFRPEERRCLVALSNGGKDADELREFDLETKQFVEGGFRLPESKGNATWIDESTLLAWRDFGPGTLTSSGYPFVVKRLKRGQSLDQAVEVFRGAPDDVSANAFTLRDADGRLQAVLVSRNVTFWENDFLLLRDDGPPVPLPFPKRNSIRGLVDGQLVFTTESAWNGFENGDLLAYDLAALKADPASAKPQLVLRPGPREAIEGVTVTRNTLVVNLSENVKGAAYVCRHGANGWTRARLPLPENATIGLSSASKESDQLFFTVSSYLLPASLWLADAASGRAEKVTSMPERFDASQLEMTQYEATSADGTKVPYFVVGPRGMPRDGGNPAVLYGYGGYQVSLLPGYSGTIGKLWLEKGGVYVVANTRGGGEFGPAWHQAAQGANRHRAHEDFVAVAQDLIARRITSPRRLGIMGGSQGGLFMGVAMTKHPELFNAAVIQVPLFDMMRFHKLLAGASWVAEYGNPDIAEQREWIAKYSPYQALKVGQRYPEPFIHTSTKDDRVHPGHARKAVARLEELGYPVLFYENTEGGHSAAANLKETAKRIALEWTYLTRKLKDDRPLTP